MGIYLHTLNLIITEKCNLMCSHCMRGNATRRGMPKEVIDKVFSNISTIDMVNITGGEPLLDINQLKLLIGSIREHNTNIDSISIITNGTQYSKELEKVLIELDSLCVHDIGYSHIFMSVDCYHNKEIERLNYSKIRQDNIENLNQLERNKSIIFSTYDDANTRLLDIGRGKNISGIKDKASRDLRYYYEEYLKIGDIGLICDITPVRFKWYKDFFNYNGRLTVNVLGDVCLITDVSFDESHRYRIGNLFEEDLASILDNRKKEEEKYCLEKKKRYI